MRSTRAEREAKRGLAEARLRRALIKLAAKSDLHPDKVLELADACLWQCATCLEPFTVPHIHRVGRIPRAILCGLCAKAIDRSDGDLLVLREHARFNYRYRSTRMRLARLVNLASIRGPFD